jgi:transcriptional regulator with XRE-family HTH domain
LLKLLAGAKELITMDLIGKVRRMKLRDGLTNSAIARRTGLSRNTGKKWLKAEGDVEPKYQPAEQDAGTAERPATPPPVTTTLTLKVAPVADTTRYDRPRTSAPDTNPIDEERGHAN